VRLTLPDVPDADPPRALSRNYSYPLVHDPSTAAARGRLMGLRPGCAPEPEIKARGVSLDVPDPGFTGPFLSRCPVDFRPGPGRPGPPARGSRTPSPRIATRLAGPFENPFATVVRGFTPTSVSFAKELLRGSTSGPRAGIVARE